jgi:DNA polymerase III subunit alpha, Gram-positive type
MPPNHHAGPIVFLDVETTGLNPHVHEIIEIGAVIARPPFEVIEASFSRKVKPENLAVASPEALRVNGYNEDEWRVAVSAKAAFCELFGFGERKMWAAHNSDFDMRFISAGFHRCGLTQDGLGFYRWDTMTMAWALLPPGSVANYRLSTIAEYLDIPREAGRHEAVKGAELCMRVYAGLREYRRSLRPVGGGA